MAITFKKQLLYFVTSILFLSILGACSARRERSLFNASSDVVTDTIKQVYVVNDQGISDAYYKIRVNDRLAIRNVQNAEFGATGNASGTPASSSNQTGSSGGINTVLSYPVDLDGQVNLPAIGKILVAGLSRREAAIKIQDLYAKQLLRNPIIELSVVNLKSAALTLANKWFTMSDSALRISVWILLRIVRHAAIGK